MYILNAFSYAEGKSMVNGAMHVIQLPMICWPFPIHALVLSASEFMESNLKKAVVCPVTTASASCQLSLI